MLCGTRDASGVGQVELAEPEHGVAPGQACVFYELPDPGARVLGGGTIMRPPVEEGQATRLVAEAAAS